MTQDDCKKQFIVVLEKFYKALETIDNETPYSDFPPLWWEELEELKRKALAAIRELSTVKG